MIIRSIIPYSLSLPNDDKLLFVYQKNIQIKQGNII